MVEKWIQHNPQLYFVTDGELNKGRGLLSVIESALSAGVRTLQLRHKLITDREFIELAENVRILCKKWNCLFIIDDRIEICALIHADGVHLGQEDYSPLDARKRLGPEAIIGYSTHNEEEVKKAQEFPISYINIGPLFPTATKKLNLYTPLGLPELLRLKLLSKLPVTTMGGIKEKHLPLLIGAGIKTVAMITQISEAENITETVKKMNSYFFL